MFWGRNQERNPAGRPSGRPRPDTEKTGRWGEKQAAIYLSNRKGLKLVGTRVRAGRGEIDLVMERPGPGPESFVFVEVKTRKSPLFGGGVAAVDRRKRHALCKAVAAFLRRHPPTAFQIDVVEVFGDAEADRVDAIYHYENAVPMERRVVVGALGR